MKDCYGVYYDFAAYFKFEFVGNGYDESEFERWADDMGFFNKFYNPHASNALAVDANRVRDKKFFHYSGIVHPDEITKSNTVRFSSIPKGETPICFMTYNKDGYVSHCKDYKEWDEWKKKRNQIRFNDNRGYNFDAKNMCETVRLIHTGIELARDGVFNVERTWDRDFLLSIKNHQVKYDEISNYVKEKKEEFDELLKKSTLPEHLDYDEINNLLIESRKKLYNF